jgi:myosin heavy subunit
LCSTDSSLAPIIIQQQQKTYSMSSNRPNANANRPASSSASNAGATADELQDQLKEEKSMRNYFQLERDRIYSFWDITKKDLEQSKAELRNKDREIEEQQEQHQVELKVYKQKVRHLLYEQKITIDRLKIEAENALKLQADEFRQKQAQLKEDKRALKHLMKSKELAHEENIKSLKNQQDKNITKLRSDFERQLKETQIKYQDKMLKLRENLESRARKEAMEIEEEKNFQIQNLMEKHKQAFEQMKNYYNGITTNNLVLIKNLKEEVARMKKNEASNEKLMFEIMADNNKLTEPLVKALSEIDNMRVELANYEKDKVSLKNAKNRMIVIEDQLKNLKWEHEILEQSYRNVQKERDELYQKFEKSIHDVQQKAMLKNQLLETKISALQEQVEKRDAQIREVIKISKLDDLSVEHVTGQMEDVIEEKNKHIRDLRFEVEKLKKMHNDLLHVIVDKMRQYGIPTEEFAMRILPTQATTAPAGLV